MGQYSNYFGEAAEISESWAAAHFLVFVGLGTVMVPVGVSFCQLDVLE